MQNTEILKKCVEELKQPTPKIDYILGMLETVIALSETTPYVPSYPSVPYTLPYPLTIPYVNTNTTGTSDAPKETDFIDVYNSNPGLIGRTI